MTQQLQTIIDAAWDNRAALSPTAAPQETLDAVEHVINELNKGQLRVATREGVGQWTTHQWIKKAQRFGKTTNPCAATGRSTVRGIHP